MQITFLGTNGWFDNQLGNTMSVLVSTQDAYIVFDAGSGFTKLDRYVTTPKPVYLFLSHFHLDHLIGLHTLTRFNFTMGLTIVGQPGTRQTLATLLDQPFTVPLHRADYPIIANDFDEVRLPFHMTTLPLIHSSPCYGYRLQADGKVVTYCTDTGYCANAVTLARDADLLIAECSRKPGQPPSDWPHLDPATAARIAMEAQARRLALAHFDANVYTTRQDRERSEAAARDLFANVFAARDDMTVTV